jgi:hypothetical protein
LRWWQLWELNTLPLLQHRQQQPAMLPGQRQVCLPNPQQLVLLTPLVVCPRLQRYTLLLLHLMQETPSSLRQHPVLLPPLLQQPLVWLHRAHPQSTGEHSK